MAAIKEKHGTHCEVNTMSYEENKPKAFERLNLDESSYRVYEDGKVGIFHCIGTVSDEEGYAKAQADPERARPYPFSPEAGSTRSRDLSETEFSAGELMALAEECMKYLTDNYPQFTFSGKFSTTRQTDTFTNDLGADYSNSDASVGIGVMFKHKDSKNIMDGDFSFNMRTPDDGTKFREMADLYLSKWDTVAEIPEDVILICSITASPACSWTSSTPRKCLSAIHAFPERSARRCSRTPSPWSTTPPTRNPGTPASGTARAA